MRILSCMLLLIVRLALPAQDQAALDGTYRMTITDQTQQWHETWIFQDGHWILPVAAACRCTSDRDGGRSLSWTVTDGDAGSGMELVQLMWHVAYDRPGAESMNASAASGLPGQPMSTTYHAQVDAQGALVGSSRTSSGGVQTDLQTFTGTRSGPPRAVRTPYALWYHVHQGWFTTTWQTDEVILEFQGVGGSNDGWGTVTLDGEGESAGTNDVTTAYSDGVATLTCGSQTVTFTDRGRTLTIGRQTFSLGTDRPTIRISSHGVATVVHHEPLAPAGVLDGHRFAVILSVAGKPCADKLFFQQGHLQMASFEALGAYPAYHATVLQVGTQVDAQQQLGLATILSVTATIAASRLHGQVTLAREGRLLLSGVITGDEMLLKP